MKNLIALFCFAVVLTSCKQTDTTNNNTNDTTKKVSEKTVVEKKTKADLIIENAIEAHGGTLYDAADYSFTFRKKDYRFTYNSDTYKYSVKHIKNDSVIVDIIENGKFQRYINELPITLTDKEIASGSSALNSVIYFATLPYKLKDASVNKKFIESTTIKYDTYDVVEVTFNKEGGGNDHDDEFHYWINTKDHKIDYLAYNYRVNKGGVRFRSYYNRRVVDGITFQDYINWKAPLNTPLKDLLKLYKLGKLEELSRIETETIINLNR